MQSAKKRTKVLSVLSIAAGTSLAAQMASGATLTMFYDNAAIVDSDYSYPGPPIGVETFPDGPSGGGGTIAQPLTLTQGVVNTINMFAGQVLEFGIDAVITNNINPDGGKITGGTNLTGFPQPTHLGLAILGMRIPSSDALGATLQPLTDGSGSQGNYPVAGGQPYFNSTAQINSTVNGAGTGVGGGSTLVPTWELAGSGDVSPTQPGQGGQVGIGFQTVGGNSSLNSIDNKANSAASLNTLQNFAGTSATMAQSTNFFDSLAYQALRSGRVTLTPFADSTATTYWSLRTPGGNTAATPSVYTQNFFDQPGDVLTPLPALVINIIGETRPIFSISPVIDGPPQFSLNRLTNSASPGADQGIFSGPGAALNALTVTGANGAYSVAQATHINGGAGDAADYVEANGFNPATDNEIYALNVLVNGVQANAAQLSTLISEANIMDDPGSFTLSTTSPVPDPFSNIYNLFVDASPGLGADNYFDWNVSSDSELTGYTIAAVAVVPEPISFGLLILCGLGMLARRHRPAPAISGRVARSCGPTPKNV